MQADGERLFTNKGPVGLMVKESDNFQKCQLPGQYLATKVTYVGFFWMIHSIETYFFTLGVNTRY